MGVSRFLTLSDVDLHRKRVLVRVDFNVPIQNGAITDDTRIRAGLPVIHQLLAAESAVILMSHLGRPQEGKFDPEFSLRPVADHLSGLLRRPVRLVDNWLNGIETGLGEVVLLENVRFLIGEKKDDEELARNMSRLCDIYVNDAFAAAHRAQASTHGVAKYAPTACAGPLLVAEVEALSKALENPARPMIAIVGGAKVSTKLGLLERLLDKVDRLIVGGGIANTFLKAAGFEIGKSLCEENLLDQAKQLLGTTGKNGQVIPLPDDVVCAKTFSSEATASIKRVADVAADDLILDIGPATAARYAALLGTAATIVWNGPLGVYEWEAFSRGTRRLAEAIAASKAFSLAGGGDTLAAVARFDIADRISYLSTGGGAFLEFLEGRALPAVAILEERARAARAAEQEY